LSYWPSAKAKRVFAVIRSVGWTLKSDKGGSHKQMPHPTWREATWSFHDSEEIGPKMMARLAKAFHFDREDI
jgi:predicted RNA binding protein YcfA (HicA-like mRNA interferase family)